MNKIFLYFKSVSKIYIYSAIAILIIVAIWLVFFRNGNGKEETIIVSPGNFEQTIAIAGKVVASKNVELGFNQSGKVTNVPVKVGDAVKAGQVIAEIDSRSAALSLNEAQVSLQKLLKPADAPTRLSAEKNLLDAQNSLTKDYDGGYNNIVSAFVDIPDILNGLDSLLNSHEGYLYQPNLFSFGQTALNYQKTASDSYYRAKNQYDDNLRLYKTISRASANSDIDNLIKTTNSTWQTVTQALKSSRTAVDYVSSQDVSGISTAIAAKSAVSGWIDKANSQSSVLVLAINNIANDKKEVDQTMAALKKLNDGADTLDIQAQQLNVAQKAKTYADYFIRAPFDGLVSKLDLKVGEVVSANTQLVSVISTGAFQIEGYVPEINIAGLRVGNPAKVTLDAYGPDINFPATVISVDPAETIRDGVSTYKTVLQFNTEDPRIKSGMTANTTISIESKSQIITVPPKAIFTEGDQKFVQVKKAGQFIKQPITTGTISALGQTEITSGLKSGDIVLVNPQI